MAQDNADKFCQLFSNFSLVIRTRCAEARNAATKEDLEDQFEYKTASQIKSMLKKANEEYAHAKKLFKVGKISKEELYDCEWRVFELKEELDKLNDKGVQ